MMITLAAQAHRVISYFIACCRARPKRRIRFGHERPESIYNKKTGRQVFGHVTIQSSPSVRKSVETIIFWCLMEIPIYISRLRSRVDSYQTLNRYYCIGTAQWLEFRCFVHSRSSQPASHCPPSGPSYEECFKWTHFLNSSDFGGHVKVFRCASQPAYRCGCHVLRYPAGHSQYRDWLKVGVERKGKVNWPKLRRRRKEVNMKCRHRQVYQENRPW